MWVCVWVGVGRSEKPEALFFFPEEKACGWGREEKKGGWRGLLKWGENDGLKATGMKRGGNL